MEYSVPTGLLREHTNTLILIKKTNTWFHNIAYVSNWLHYIITSFGRRRSCRHRSSHCNCHRHRRRALFRWLHVNFVPIRPLYLFTCISINEKQNFSSKCFQNRAQLWNENENNVPFSHWPTLSKVLMHCFSASFLNIRLNSITMPNKILKLLFIWNDLVYVT